MKPRLRIRQKSIQPRDASTTQNQIDVTATEAKNGFGRILESAIRGRKVFITKHDDRKAVLLSMDEFESLSRSAETKLNTLSTEFDALLSAMQAPSAGAKMKAAFDASPQQVGKAALKAAQKRD
jgi:prevent-host-death family protein